MFFKKLTNHTFPTFLGLFNILFMSEYIMSTIPRCASCKINIHRLRSYRAEYIRKILIVI
jgi:hypothetical protein